MSRPYLSIKNYKIAPTRQKDVNEMLKITKECGLAPWSREDYLDDLKRDDSISFTASIDGIIAGFVIGRIVPSAVKATVSDAELYNIGVSRSFQNKGIGSSLFKKFLSKCSRNKVKNIFLEVRISNKTAISFYKKHGFEIASKRKNFYSDPAEDAFVMLLTLSPKYRSNRPGKA